ncbi:hypothetical protein [Rhodococcus sp. NPDC076796]|uniref:hypothetical protein n=1 Tax=Rhodococcus sp. NPDC076796 TaxID=3154859 RepID=UPI00344EA58B
MNSSNSLPPVTLGEKSVLDTAALIATVRTNAELAGSATEINDYGMYASRALDAAEQLARHVETLPLGASQDRDHAGDIWVLVVDDRTSPTTSSLHTSEQSAIDCLVLNFDPVDRDDPVQSLRNDGYTIHLDSHPIPHSAASTEKNANV